MPSASKAARNSSRCFHSCCVSRPLARRAASRRNGPIRLMSSESAGVPSAGPESETKWSSYLPSSSAAIGGHRGAIRVYSAASSSWDGEVQSARSIFGRWRSTDSSGSVAISGNQWQSVAISGHQWPSVAISGHQWQSVAISGNQWQSVAISGNQWQSVAISGNQWQSVAISGNQWQSVAISGNQWQSVAISGNQCSLTHPDHNAMPSR